MAHTLPRLPVFEAIAKHDPESTVAVHSLSGRTFKYGQLLGDVCRTRSRLHEAAGRDNIDGERIAFLVENSYDYVVTLLAILAARSIAVPLAPAFPPPELQYILDHSEASLFLSSSRFTAKAEAVLAQDLASRPKHVPLAKYIEGGAHDAVTLEGVDAGAAGLMLYTSGTTNRPKGVLLPERVMTAQARSLVQAWEYSPTDYLLHVLPLHHIHGTINALYAPLFSGSAIEFLFPFNADAVWRRFAEPFLPAESSSSGSNGDHTPMPDPILPETNGDSHITTNGLPNGANGLTNGNNGSHHTSSNGTHPIPNGTHTNLVNHPSSSKAPITFFTVVPTVYSRLLATHKHLPADLRTATRTAISPANLRLNISGSAALPQPIRNAWTDLSHGNVLLERFGMTEVGMALSCGLDPADRIDGSVGWPLPGVEARLVDLDTGKIIKEGEEVDSSGRERAGEIQLRGPGIFSEYWRNPTATAKEFVADESSPTKPPNGTPTASRTAWFKTGDVAIRRPVPSSGTSTRPSQSSWARGPAYFILGRRSADIIKSGGEKVSALEVERELLSLPEVSETAVVAVPSGKWGQKVGAVVVLDAEGFEGRPVRWTPLDMRRALKPRLVAYKIPQVLRVVEHIPRNAMGKINKRVLVQEVFKEEWSGDEGQGVDVSAREVKRRRMS